MRPSSQNPTTSITLQQKTRSATNLGLKPPLEHLLGGELKHEVEFPLVFAEETEPDHAAQQGGALEQALRVLSVQRQELAGSLPKTDRTRQDTMVNAVVVLQRPP